MLDFDGRPDALHLRAVRVRGAADGLQARQRLEAALAEIAASELGLPPRALLIVRRLAPAARLRLGGAGRADGFGRAVRGGLGQLLRRAARPAADPAAAGAAAVIFADEAELVCCLLQDWLSGRLGERWWWASVLRGRPPAKWCRRVVLPRGDLLPAVLSGLAARGQAVGWVLRLSQSEAAQAVARLMADHAMSPFSGTPHQLAGGVRLDLEPDRPAPRLAPGPPAASPDAETLVQRLREIVPEVTAPALSDARRRLLAVGLGLHRASAWTRSSEFELALAALEMHELVSLDEEHNAGRVLPHEQQNPDLAVSEERSNTVLPPADLSEAFLREAIEVNGGSPAPLSPPLIPTDPRSAGADAPQIESGRAGFERSHDGGGPRPDRLRRPGGSAMQAPRNPDLLPASSIGVGETLVPSLSSRSVQTGFGGIFYLLNAALALGVYGDFAQPRTPGIALSPWDWLALIGRAWFGGDFARDAVWLLLAELAGRRPTEYPGYGFAPPEDWSVPAEWLEPWGEAEVVRVYATRQRLQLWHDAGFLISDNPRVATTAPLRQARALCIQNSALRRAGLQRLRQLPHRHSRRALSRWVQYTILYLAARLARALGDGASAAIPAIVCRHSARLVVTATIVEIHLSLADLPIQIRLAGLDRNPGWIPAAGRSVVFYFA